ncbi:MAG: hypothetical protein OEY77_00275 [Nitrospira sp.]|nr:hypothetical protein [Nitrospira sp.]
MSDAVAIVEALGGEVVTYMPYGGTARQIKAVVEREPSRVSAFSGVAYPENAMIIAVPRDVVNGVLTIAKGKDHVRFKRSISDATETEFTVAMVQDEDVGMIPGDSGMYLLLVK